MAEGIKPPVPGGAGGAVPGGAGGAGGTAGGVAKAAQSAKAMQSADTAAGKTEHGAQAVADAGKQAGGLWGAGIGAAGQGVSKAAAAKDAGEGGGTQTKEALKGAAMGAVGGALGGKDGGKAEAATGSVADKLGNGGAGGAMDSLEKDAKDTAGGGKDAKGASPDESSGMGTGLKAAGAGAAGAGGAQGFGMMLVAMNLLNMAKAMMMAGLAAAANLATTFLGGLAAAAANVVGFFAGIGSAISGALGGAISATAAAILAGVLVVSGAGVGGAVVVNAAQAGNAAQRDYISPYCEVDDETRDALDADVNPGAETLANAKTAYGVLSAWGMADEDIAGILGNWKAESGVDPTGVEGIYDEPFKIGPKKEQAEKEDFGGYTNSLGNTMEVRGLGLGQWTNGRGQKLIDFADAVGKDWHSIETQLAFMIGGDNPGSIAIIKDMISNSRGSVAAATKHFHDVWEVSADTDLSHREKAASEMFALMDGWEKNSSLADSLLELAGTTVEGANGSRQKSLDKDRNCEPSGGANGKLVPGGMTLEEAEAFMEKYRNGDWLPTYGGDCSGGAKFNCVAFSDYFVTNYTDLKPTTANGGGMATAVASHNGLKTGSDLKAYSVFEFSSGAAACAGASDCGHTGIILGVQGDKVIIGEANCSLGAPGPIRAYEVDGKQWLAENSPRILDLTDHMSEDAGAKT